MPNYETLQGAVGDLRDALQKSNALPPGFPLLEVQELLDAIALFPDSSAEELPIKLQAAESALSDLRGAYVPRETAQDDGIDLPSFQQVRLAASDVMAELRGVLSMLDPIVVATTTPTGDQLSARVPAADQDAALAEVVDDTRQADEVIGRGQTVIIENQNNYSLFGGINIWFNDLIIDNALIRITAKLGMVRRHWLEKLGEAMAKTPDAILATVRALPVALCAIEIVARELKEATNRIVAHLEQYLSRTQPPSARSGRRPDLSIFRDADWAPKMVVIPAGSFMMGSPNDEKDRFENDEKDRFEDEGPQHEVTIARRFALGRFPVTFEEYDRYCDAAGAKEPDDEGWGRAGRPVINVNWEDAQKYVDWLNETLGLAHGTYRLPSEAEWEYACRAGTKGHYSFDEATVKLDAYAWFGQNSADQSHPVGEKLANPWKLFDMHGNVWEWTGDHWHEDYTGAPDDGSAWIESDAQLAVLRGGSWYNGPGYLRAAFRYGCSTGNRNFYFGFRVARTLR